MDDKTMPLLAAVMKSRRDDDLGDTNDRADLNSMRRFSTDVSCR
jgi:hypothetical protein